MGDDLWGFYKLDNKKRGGILEGKEKMSSHQEARRAESQSPQKSWKPVWEQEQMTGQRPCVYIKIRYKLNPPHPDRVPTLA